jgi:ATP-dependent helicase YprA (DUF1998 family)
VLDEMHIYRGIFGSNVANLLRRMRRICRFYGSEPHFILTSATIANPKELAERLIEAPVRLIPVDLDVRLERETRSDLPRPRSTLPWSSAHRRPWPRFLEAGVSNVFARCGGRRRAPGYVMHTSVMAE